MSFLKFEDLFEMDGAALLKLSRTIYLGIWDKKTFEKLGRPEDAVHEICLILLQFKSGERKFQGGDLTVAVASIARFEARKNWMCAAFSDDKEIADELEKSEDSEDLMLVFQQEDGDEENDSNSLENCAYFSHGEDEHEDADSNLESLDLSAFEVLLLRHHDQTDELAEFFGLAERTIRKKRRELFEKLVEKYNLAPDFFVMDGKRYTSLAVQSKAIAVPDAKVQPVIPEQIILKNPEQSVSMNWRAQGLIARILDKALELRSKDRAFKELTEQLKAYVSARNRGSHSGIHLMNWARGPCHNQFRKSDVLSLGP